MIITAAVGLVILVLNIPSMLVSLVLFGNIPGFEKSISPTLMIYLYLFVTAIVTFVVLGRIIQSLRSRKRWNNLANHRHLPKRRYARNSLKT